MQSDCFEIFQSQFGHPRNIALQVPIMLSLLDRRNKMLERTLATLNASSPTMSHALATNKRCSNRSHILQFVLHQLVSPAFLLAWLHSISAMRTALKVLCSEQVDSLSLQYPPIVAAVTSSHYLLGWKMRIELNWSLICPLARWLATVKSIWCPTTAHTLQEARESCSRR